MSTPADNIVNLPLKSGTLSLTNSPWDAETTQPKLEFFHALFQAGHCKYEKIPLSAGGPRSMIMHLLSMCFVNLLNFQSTITQSEFSIFSRWFLNYLL